MTHLNGRNAERIIRAAFMETDLQVDNNDPESACVWLLGACSIAATIDLSTMQILPYSLRLTQQTDSEYLIHMIIVSWLFNKV